MKLTKSEIKRLILEEIGGPSNIKMNTGNSKRSLAHAFPGTGKLRNYPKGQPPENHNYQPYDGSDPYETGEIENDIPEGEELHVNGDVRYILVFGEGSKRKSGYVKPVDQYMFHIDEHTGQLTWNGDVPFHVENNSDLEKQILDYSGRES